MYRWCIAACSRAVPAGAARRVSVVVGSTDQYFLKFHHFTLNKSLIMFYCMLKQWEACIDVDLTAARVRTLYSTTVMVLYHTVPRAAHGKDKRFRSISLPISMVAFAVEADRCY